MTEIKIKKLDEKAILPTYGTEFSAGADLYALGGESITIPAHKTVMIHTGLSMEIPEGYAGLIFARSGLASKRGLAPANKVGVVDPDYRGEFMVALHNHGSESREIESGERIAQIALVPYLTADFNVVGELSDTDRGAGGFGSTGRK